jgi:hypothetical protein
MVRFLMRQSPGPGRGQASATRRTHRSSKRQNDHWDEATLQKPEGRSKLRVDLEPDNRALAGAAPSRCEGGPFPLIKRRLSDDLCDCLRRFGGHSPALTSRATEPWLCQDCGRPASPRVRHHRARPLGYQRRAASHVHPLPARRCLPGWPSASRKILPAVTLASGTLPSAFARSVRPALDLVPYRPGSVGVCLPLGHDPLQVEPLGRSGGRPAPSPSLSGPRHQTAEGDFIYGHFPCYWKHVDGATSQGRAG